MERAVCRADSTLERVLKMKVVLLAGGLGTRLSEETQLRPKPMVEIGGFPILWHIMKGYAAFGLTDFVVCCGYKGYVIKEYFANYALHNSDVTFDLKRGLTTTHRTTTEPWRVTLVDTGDATMTGGRLKRVAQYLDPGQTFCMTYGDGVADVDIGELLSFHRESGLQATVTAVQPPGRFGRLGVKEDRVVSFDEKPDGDGHLINAGFFVLEPGVLEYIEGDNTVWEASPLRALAESGQLGAYRHGGFWSPMDTLRDRIRLEELWAAGHAPWKTWI